MTALSSTTGASAPVYTPPTAEFLPDPTAPDLALAAKPNLLVEPRPRPPPPTPKGPARKQSRRHCPRAAPSRLFLGVREGAADHIGDAAEMF